MVERRIMAGLQNRKKSKFRACLAWHLRSRSDVDIEDVMQIDLARLMKSFISISQGGACLWGLTKTGQLTLF